MESSISSENYSSDEKSFDSQSEGEEEDDQPIMTTKIVKSKVQIKAEAATLLLCLNAETQV